MTNDEPRQLSRNETHDLGMIIKDRAKVLRAHVEQRAAEVLADFESKIAAVYAFDDDEVWEKAVAEAQAVVKESQDKIAERCKVLGIPKDFAPALLLEWRTRGQNAVASRRVELRRVAKTRIDAMAKAAVTKIEHQSLDLRTQVVAMGQLSPQARLFLESLAPIDETMRSLEFREVELALEDQTARRRRGDYS
jgi:hypothetical protein